MLEPLKYTPAPFEEVKSNYSNGKKYIIEKWQWGYNKEVTPSSYKEVMRIIDCPTLDKFEEEIWDLFADFAEKNSVAILWGSPNDLKQMNPKRKCNPYYDGIIFALIGPQFVECAEYKNRDVSHFMSCLINFGYYNLNFKVVE